MASSAPTTRPPEAWLAEAQGAERAGRPQEAARLLAAADAAHPGHPAILNARGAHALRSGDAAAARDFHAAAAAADPAATQLWINLAAACRALGDDAGEQAALERALETDQRAFMALLRLAELHERRGEHAQATPRWNAVLTLAGQLAEIPPGLQPILAHAQAYVARQMADFARVMEEGLDPLRAPLPPAERRRFDACLDVILGRRRIYLNEPEGLHYPFLPADEFFDEAHFPWFAELEAATPVIRAELEALMARGAPGLEPYVAMAPGTPANKWSPLDHKLDWGAVFLWKFGERIDAACAACPETARIIERLPLADMPGRAPTAFFSIIRPKTRLPAHTGVSNVRAIVHLPLIVPPGCGFRVGGETRQWIEGKAFAFDDTIEHEAWNDSDRPRAILILDTWNPHLSEAERALMRRFFQVADGSGHNPAGRTAVAD